MSLTGFQRRRRKKKAEEKAQKAKKVDILDGNVSEVQKAIANIDILERLEKLLELEVEGNNRKTVIEPLETKIEELQEEDQSEGDK